MTVDPIHDCLTYTIDQDIVACDKKSNSYHWTYLEKNSESEQGRA